jgi:predicted SnoaL-like aldol condensation-catalyzing enzyme
MTCRYVQEGGYAMANSDIEKALTLLQGIGSGNADLATRHVHRKRYVEHDPRSADGVDGLREYIRELSKENHHLKVVRAFQDGIYVFTQTDGLILGKNTFFDIFRFQDGLIVEHWVFPAKAAPPNESGHTQTDGPIDAKHINDTEKNKSFMREYYQTFHVSGDHSRANRYFTGDLCIRHEPGVRDGVAEFLRDVEVLMQHRTIDEVKLLLGQGDFVFIAAKGTHEGDPCVYIDLYRVEDEKIVEHWGFPERVPPQEEWKNNNGIL